MDSIRHASPAGTTKSSARSAFEAGKSVNVPHNVTFVPRLLYWSYKTTAGSSGGGRTRKGFNAATPLLRNGNCDTRAAADSGIASLGISPCDLGIMAEIADDVFGWAMPSANGIAHIAISRRR